MVEKRTESVKIWLTETEMATIKQMAISADRKPSDFIGIVLHRYIFGHSKPRLLDVQEDE